MTDSPSPFSLPNVKRFIAFRLLFNARFYYPVFTILFLDFGLSLEQFALLNTVWAVTIVCLEVPSGSLADVIGRKNLLVVASVTMFVELLLITLAPIGGGEIVFYLFLLNRILSGLAEAAASGADEALAYDSLKAAGLESSWDKVLERQMRFQSVAFVLAMTTGALLYDAERLNAILSFFGINSEIEKSIAMRLPLLGTLALSVLAIITTLGMKENASVKSSESLWQNIRQSMAGTLGAGSWILRTPLALAIIAAGKLFDHAARMTLTLTSEFYRQIQIPEYTFGFIGSGLGLLGIFLPKLGKAMLKHRTKLFNFLCLSASVFIGLWLMSRFVPYWSALPMIFVYAGVSLNGYFVSNYLNQITDSRQRATVLSFKGLCFNLAYGGVGYIYAMAIKSLRESEAADSVATPDQGYLFQTVFAWGPYYFLTLSLATLGFAWLVLRRSDKQTP